MRIRTVNFAILDRYEFFTNMRVIGVNDTFVFVTCVNFTGVTNTFISVTCIKNALLIFHKGYLFLRILCSFGEIKFDLTLVFSSFGVHE